MRNLILLIDDDQEELEIMNEALRKGNITGTCVWANGALHAMRIVDDVSPDIIFIDVNMPGMNGITCLQELKKNDHLTNTPMVIYSTAFNDETCKTAKQHGALCCIQKPDNLDNLVKELTWLLLTDNPQGKYA